MRRSLLDPWDYAAPLRSRRWSAPAAEPLLPRNPAARAPVVPLRAVPPAAEEAEIEPQPAAPPERSPAAQSESPGAGELARMAARIEAHHQAELEKAKTRIERAARREVELEQSKLLRDLLEVVDDLDRALDSSGGADSLSAGVEMVRGHFLDKLRAHGVEVSDDVGRPFDPAEHEAITTIEVSEPGQDGRVLQVVLPGYRLRGDILRPATVVVGKLPLAALQGKLA